MFENLFNTLEYIDLQLEDIQKKIMKLCNKYKKIPAVHYNDYYFLSMQQSKLIEVKEYLIDWLTSTET